MMLAFSWISFNGSSVLSTDHSNLELSAHAVTNTLLSLGGAGVTSVMFPALTNKGTYDLPLTINSMLGGLVAVTAPCAFIDNWNAILLGVMSSLLTMYSSYFVMMKLRVDDPLDAFSVHGACGIFGTIWTGLFARKDLLALVNHTKGAGLFYTGDPELFLAQLAGCGVVILLTTASIAGACISFHLALTALKAARGSDEIVVDDIGEEDGGLYGEDESAETDSVEEGNLNFFEKVMLSLRFSKDAEIVGADFIYHEGNAFELTKNQVIMYNQEKNAQDRIQRRRDAARRE
jgi:ammonium transporter, Amt family